MSVSESTARRYTLADPDVRLMLQVRDDSAAAFEELVERFQGRLLRVLTHLVGDRDQAEDLVQEVFFRVFKARKTYVPEAKFSTWLFTIANNAANSALRKRLRRRERNLHGGDESGAAARPLERMIQASSGQMPARQLDKAEARSLVRMAIGSLSERQRMAVLLCKFENMSYADIAESMQLSQQAVKALLFRARVNLRDVLEPYFEA